MNTATDQAATQATAEPTTVSPTDEPVTAASYQPDATPLNGHDTSEPSVAAIPAHTDEIVVRPSAAVVDKATLNAIVTSAGLQWVESDPSRVEIAQREVASQPQAKLGREPKIVPPPAAVQLTQVETRANG